LGLAASKNRQKSYPQFGKDKLMTIIRTCVSILATFLILAVAMTAPAGAVSEVEKIALTDAEKEWLAAHSKIVVGGETDWAPFDFVDQTGKYVGIADDYLKIIGEKLGIEVEMVTGPSWDELLTMLRRKEIDVLPAIYHSKEREAYVHFTAPYLKLNEFIFTTSVRDIPLRATCVRIIRITT
jgi:ABC-type amino acid transport substrate-binding protein